MTAQITLNLPNAVYERAENLAHRTGRNVADVLSTMLEASLAVDLPLASQKLLETLPDNELLALANSRMDSVQNARMSALLAKQQADVLDEVEQHELSLLLHIYQEGSLQKARALGEVMRRGLHKAPDA